MRVLFYGTPEFAVPALIKLIQQKHEVVGVVTQADNRSGRGLKLTPPPIKVVASSFDIPIFQPERINQPEFLSQLKELPIDLGVVAAYGQFIPRAILELPKYRTINIHPSLLPRYRGAAPINWALINGDKETGVSIIYLIPEMDAGDIISQEKLRINHDDNALSLSEKLAQLGGDCLLSAIDLIDRQKVKARPQDAAKVVLAPRLKKEMGRLDWDNASTSSHNLIRGLNPYWSTKTVFRGKTLKVTKSRITKDIIKPATPGTIVSLNRRLGPVVACKNGGALILTKIQMPGKKEVDGARFINGYQIKIGERFFKL